MATSLKALNHIQYSQACICRESETYLFKHKHSHYNRRVGAAITSHSFKEEYVAHKVKTWCEELCVLANIALTQPHAVSVLVHVAMSG